MKKLYKLLLISLLILNGGNAMKAQSYNNDDSKSSSRAVTPTYISKIAVAYGDEASTPKNILNNQGFTIIDYDLNKGCGSTSHYIYMGYKTTTNPAEAITGIFFRKGNNPPNYDTFDGVTAYLLGESNETNPGEDKAVDLNVDAGGDYIYTYVTRNTSRAAVLDGLYFDGSSSASGYVTPNVNLNSGTKGGAIYLHYKQFSGKASATFHYLNSNGSRTSSTTSVSVKHHQQAVNNTPSAPTSVTYDGRTWTLLGWREDNNATTAGSNPSYTYMDSKVYRAVYSADVSLTYNANGGSNTPSKQTAKQYVNAGSSSIAKSNTSFTIPSTTPTHDATKCNFAGWGTSSSSTTAQYQAGGSISINKNTTLYAVWPEHNGTQTYVNNGSNHTYTWSCCQKSVTEDHIYDNGIDNYCGAHIHEIDGNGYCNLCNGYPAELVNGYYEIYNADNLFWFAEYVNTIDRTASAKLMNDIDLENRPWTPIGTTGESCHNFRGHFDGNGKTITGLNVTVTRNGGGFFGEVRLGTVEDFTIYGEVKLNGNHSYVGGVIGSAPGANSNKPEHNGATIRNITSYVNVTLGEGSHGSNHVAGFIGYANHETLIENCTWYGTLDLDAYRAQDGVGGLVGKANDNSEITIRNCAAYGTIKTSYQSGSYNSHNNIFIGGIVSNSVENAQTTLENCIWAGTLIDNTNLGSNAHISAIGTLNGIKSVSNCYALNNMPYITTNNAHKTGITKVTAEQLASGEIAYKLQGTQATQIWGQNIDNGETADSKPILGGAKVYGIIYDGGGIYSNTNITAGGKCGDNLYWTVSNNTLTIFGTGAMYDYGSTSNKAPWRSLNPAPTSLVLEEGISHIGNSAFRECYRFTGSLTIPNSVTTIGDDAFYKCSGFKEVYSLSKTAPTLGTSAFIGINNNAILYYPASSEPSYDDKGWFNYFSQHIEFNGQCGDNLYWRVDDDNTLTIFGTGAMYDYDNIDNKAPWRSLNPAPKSLVLEKGIIYLGNYAFQDCSGFTEVYSLAETAPALGTDAFKNINENATLYYPSLSEQNYEAEGWFDYFSKRIGFNGKCGDNLYWNIDDENTLTIFGTGAMYDYGSSNKAPWRSLNPAPTSLVMEEGISHIGNSAFEECSRFRGSLTIPNSVTSIGAWAFYQCSGFTGSLTIPNSVTSIGRSAFRECSGFTGSLTIGNSVTTIVNSAFEECSGFTGSLTIPNSVTYIGNFAFQNCSGFTGSLTIGNSVTTIGESAFEGCSGLTGSLTIPNSVTYIGNYAFQKCSGFNGSLTIPNSVTTIGVFAFEYCSGFTGSLTIPNSVTTIGNSAFYNCYGFTGSLTIPNSVTTIGNSAFYNCYGFTEIFFYRDTNPTIGTGAFSSINANAKVYAPVIWESFDNIPEDKLVKMATYVGLKTNDEGQKLSTTGWVFPEGMTEVGENDHVAINAPLVLGSQQDYKTTRLQVEDDGSQQPIANSLSVKSFGLCGNENTTNGNIIIEDGGQLYCEIANGEVTVKKEILGYQQSESRSESGSGSRSESESKWYTIASPLKDAIQITPNSTLLTPNSTLLTPNSDYDLYRYDEPSHTWQNAKNSANNGFNTIDPGRGYLYANAENTTLEFKGNINTETVTYNLTAKSDVLKGFHLVGNPFTHDITFAHLNATEDASLVNGYYVLNGEGAWGATLGSNEEDIIKVGQGILVKATAEGTLAIVKTQSRKDAESQSRGQQTTDNGQQSLCISVSNAKYSDRAFVVFDKGVGLDKMNHENEDIPLLYIPMEDADYAIAMMDINVNEIPVNFETNVMGEYTISLRQENCEFDELYLLDKETDEKVNILEQDYTFIATSNENPERFILMKNAQGSQLEAHSHFAYINNGDIVIYNIEGDANIKIFDALGRCVYQGESSDETTRIANGYSSGVYMIQKVDDNGVKVQKVMID